MKYSEFIAKLKKDIDEVLGDQVLKAVQEAEADAIEKIVYSVYPPKIYERRSEISGLDSADGLSSRNNMVGSVYEGTLTVINITKPNQGPMRLDPNYYTSMPANAPLAELIEYGGGHKGYVYDYDVPQVVYGPRPFTRETINYLHKGKKHIQSLASGLVKKGYAVS